MPSLKSNVIMETLTFILSAVRLMEYVARHVANNTRASETIADTRVTMVTADRLVSILSRDVRIRQALRLFLDSQYSG